jgi:DNA-directed RNA polymerase specialized sigma24 family protein
MSDMKLELISENKIVDALKEGVSGAVEKVVSLHGNRLLRSAYLLPGSETEAQDLVQETFLQVMPSIKRFKGKSSL